MFEYKGKTYRSKKHPVLEYIFAKYNPKWDSHQEVIAFTLRDITEGYAACNIPRPTSTSNTILDLCRKKGSISSRVPESISKLGYDLRKRTGRRPGGLNYAGEFVHVGIGKEIQSWFEWPETFDREKVISSAALPEEINHFLRRDEGALFSVIDYCDVLSQALYDETQTVRRVQNPMKWQPNEIDGFYLCKRENLLTVFPIEAKALTTKDDINLEQLQGALNTVSEKYRNLHHELFITPLAIQMVPEGLLIAVFESCKADQPGLTIKLKRTVKAILDPKIDSWQPSEKSV